MENNIKIYKDIKIDYPDDIHFKDILFFLDVLTKNGYEAYLVGGCVRDFLLNKKPKDYDITTNALPNQIVDCFNQENTINHRGIEIIPTGLKHGTVTIYYQNRTASEITTYRIDGDYIDSRHPNNVEFTKSLKEDLSRRDLTINALAYHPSIGIVDCFHGVDDLTAQTIKTVGNPNDRFKEDALRMMRAIRFSCQLGFKFDTNVIDAIFKNRLLINEISKERICDELNKIVKSNVDYGIQLLNKTGLLEIILPELFVLDNLKQNNPYHKYDVLEHTLTACRFLKEELFLNSDNKFIKAIIEEYPEIIHQRENLLIATLLHDIGKGFEGVKTTDNNGVDHFYEHSEASVKLADSILKRLRFPNKDRLFILSCIKYHDSILKPNLKKMYKYLVKEKLGKHMFYAILIVQYADIMAQSELEQKERIENLFNVFNFYNTCLLERPYKISQLKTNGNILKEKYPNIHGKMIGIKLEHILTQCFYHPEKNV